MRRADPSHDGDGASLPSYPDSDVGSSPRSVGGFAGGRAGYPTEETLQPMKWDDSAFARVKLMCSYGGRIIPRPHDNQLRYVGGDSRIAVVSRNITFSELIAKLSRMFGSLVMIKYQLPYEDLDALISVTSDEDLENMMEEYDRLQSVAHQNVGSRSSPSTRLRLFLFPSELERSETGSLSDMMENDHSRERWFVDILNAFPAPSRVRSETSSIVSETTDNTFQGNNMDALEEWAAAASYGNSLPSTGEQVSDNKQGIPVSPATLFGSLLQQPTSIEAASAPGSPSPFKLKPTAMGSSSSAPPGVLSAVPSIAGAASKELPSKSTEGDGLIDNFSSKIHLGSADSSASVPEQRKHVDSETLLTSDKNILNSIVGDVEQVLPTSLMDDDDTSQKYSAKGSFDEVSEGPEAAVFDAGLHQVLEASKAFKGVLVSESTALSGQSNFDNEVLTTHILARNLNVIQGEQASVSPKIMSPSNTSPASAPLVPPGLNVEHAVPKFGSDEKLKHQAFPVSPRAGMHMGSEDKVLQQALQAPPLNVMPPPRGDLDDGSSRQTIPSLAHFLPSQMAPQQPSTVVTGGEDTGFPQVLVTNAARDAESIHKFQGAAVTVPLVTSPTFVPAPAQQEKLPLVPGPSYFYQQSSTSGLEAPFSEVIQVTQTPPIQLPLPSQITSPAMGMVSKPLPSVAVPVMPANVVAASRPAAGVSRPQSPPIAAPQYAPPLIPQVRTTSPSAPTGPSKLVSNAGQLDALRGNATVSTNPVPTVPTTIISTRAEAITVRGSPYPQVDMVNIQRQGADSMHSPRMAAIAPQLGTQYNAANIGVPHAPGMPTRFRAVGHPLQQVVEGVPVQQAALAGIITDKKAPSALMTGPSPSLRPLSAPGGQYSYVSAALQSPAGLGGSPRFHTPTNVILGALPSSAEMPPFTGANPFVDGFPLASADQDAIEGPAADQSQRYAMHQK